MKNPTGHAHQGPLGLHGVVVDLDTNAAVPRTIRFEAGAKVSRDGDGSWLVSGVLHAYDVDCLGNVRKDNEGNPKTYRAKGRFRIVPPDAKAISSPALGAEKCAKCPSKLTLPGSELCPACNAKAKSYRHCMRAEALASPMLQQKCCECSRTATVMVSDEVLVSPSAVKRRLEPNRTHSRIHTLYYERGATIGRRFYCQWHYVPPRILDAKGEVVSVG